MKRAFTLSEVLITLGVIGVVAAMTLPTVIKNYQKQRTVNQLKKVYTVLNQAFKMSEIDNDTFENWSKIEDEITQEEYAKKYFIPYLKVIKTCDRADKCGYSSSTPFKNLNNKTLPFHSYGIILNDGTYIGFKKSSIEGIRLFIDINGLQAPNMYSKDTFVFFINRKGIFPCGYGGNVTTYCSKNHTSNDSGEQCGGKIMNDGWKIKDDYPW